MTFLAGVLIGWLSAGSALWALSRRNRTRPPAGSLTPRVAPPAAEPAGQDLAGRINNEKITAIGRFASVVSHELKNPLASLKNIAYYFSKAVTFEDPRAKRMVEMLGREVDNMNEMITNLLDLTRIKRIEKVPSDIGVLAEEAFQDMPLPASITVNKTIEKIPLSVDPQRFKQVIATLIANARDAMPAGGRIDFILKRNGPHADISLADTGSGMDPETCERAFEPLFTTKTKVLGLGLTVAREIVNIHDGHIAISSEKGKGTTVTITLPIP